MLTPEEKPSVPMDADKPNKPWWRRKRTWAVAAAALLAYPLSFVPAMWVLMRTDVDGNAGGRQAIRVVYRPAATALMACPDGVRRSVAKVVNVAATDEAEFALNGSMICVLEGGDRGRTGRGRLRPDLVTRPRQRDFRTAPRIESSRCSRDWWAKARPTFRECPSGSGV